MARGTRRVRGSCSGPQHCPEGQGQPRTRCTELSSLWPQSSQGTQTGGGFLQVPKGWLRWGSPREAAGARQDGRASPDPLCGGGITGQTTGKLLAALALPQAPSLTRAKGASSRPPVLDTAAVWSFSWLTSPTMRTQT